MHLRLFLHPMKILVLLLSSKVFRFGRLIVERILLLLACFGSICQSFGVNMMVLVGILRQCLVARSFDVVGQIYLAGQRDVLECARQEVPEIARCCLENQERGDLQIEAALELECERIQFSVNCCTDDDIRRARQLGLSVNYFYCDDPAEGKRLLEVGVTTLLTNHPERYAGVC